MYAARKARNNYPWWRGNARFIDLSNTFIVAHVAQAALIMIWAGVFTLFELAVYTPEAPMYSQGLILLPHLASEGWGVGSGGVLEHSFPILAIGAIHIVAGGVLAGGAYFHRTRLTSSLAENGGRALKFHFTWDDPKQLGLILGHHLLILGLGALLLVLKATAFGGLYDSTIGEVRLVANPTLDVGTILSYRTHLFDVNNLEDLVGGHVYVAVLLLLGGAWHILVPPFRWVRETFLFSGDGILAYSLFGIALAGFAASYYCGFNTLAYPTEFYGPTLALKSAFPPFYYDTSGALESGYSARTWLANAHFYLAFFFLQGGLWHYQRAMGFSLDSLFANWRRNIIEASDNPVLTYQKPVAQAAAPMPQVLYGTPQAAPQPMLVIEQQFEDFVYQPSQAMVQAGMGTSNGVDTTLYQTRFRSRRQSFYGAPATTGAKAAFGYGRRNGRLYEPPRARSASPAYPTPLNQVVYEPSQKPPGFTSGAAVKATPPPPRIAKKEPSERASTATRSTGSASSPASPEITPETATAPETTTVSPKPEASEDS